MELTEKGKRMQQAQRAIDARAMDRVLMDIDTMPDPAQPVIKGGQGRDDVYIEPNPPKQPRVLFIAGIVFGVGIALGAFCVAMLIGGVL